jgi:hypothetical protein
MFFFVLRSQLVGSPFMLDTRLRSGVPPHMGQSLAGSDRAASVDAIANEPINVSAPNALIVLDMLFSELRSWERPSVRFYLFL